MLPIEIILDEWARPPELPDPAAMPVQAGHGYPDAFQRRLMLDAMLTARIRQPGPLCIVTGC